LLQLPTGGEFGVFIYYKYFSEVIMEYISLLLKKIRSESFASFFYSSKQLLHNI